MSDVRWTACEGKALLILTGVFLAGIASGGVAIHVFEAHRTMASAAGSVEQTAEDEYRSQSAVAVENLCNAVITVQGRFSTGRNES